MASVSEFSRRVALLFAFAAMMTAGSLASPAPSGCLMKLRAATNAVEKLRRYPPSAFIDSSSMLKTNNARMPVREESDTVKKVSGRVASVVGLIVLGVSMTLPV